MNYNYSSLTLAKKLFALFAFEDKNVSKKVLIEDFLVFGLQISGKFIQRFVICRAYFHNLHISF